MNNYQPGDRVRVTFEGTVLCGSVGHRRIQPETDWVVEVIESTPPKTGPSA